MKVALVPGWVSEGATILQRRARGDGVQKTPGIIRLSNAESPMQYVQRKMRQRKAMGY
jgi:hypothetical protein